MSEEPFGAYCPQHGAWLRSADGKIFHYPTKGLMAAHLESMHFTMSDHLLEVTQIGTQQRVDPSTMSDGSALCPAPPSRSVQWALARGADEPPKFLT